MDTGGTNLVLFHAFFADFSGFVFGLAQLKGDAKELRKIFFGRRRYDCQLSHTEIIFVFFWLPIKKIFTIYKLCIQKSSSLDLDLRNPRA